MSDAKLKETIKFVSLNKIGKWQSGYAFPGTSFTNKETGIPIVRMSDLKYGNLDLADSVNVPKSYMNTHASFALKDGDFLMGMSGSLENYATVKENDLPALLNQRVGRLSIHDPDTDYKFITFHLISEAFKKHIARFAAGAAQLNISSSQIESFEIPLPQSIEKQRHIAEILSTIDEAIEHTEALIAKTQQIKAGLMHDLFTRGVLPNGQLRPPRTDSPDLYKESPLGWIPIEWEVFTIGSKASLMTNGFVGTATPFYTTPNNGVMYLYGNNIRKNLIDTHGCLYVSDEFHTRQTKSQLHQGDILTVQSGHIGTSAVVPALHEPVNCHALIITRLKPNSANPYYISRYLNSDIGMRRLSTIFVGSTILHINTSDLHNFSIPAPNNLDEQQTITDILTMADNKVKKESDQASHLKMMKNGLMHDLLTRGMDNA